MSIQVIDLHRETFDISLSDLQFKRARVCGDFANLRKLRGAIRPESVSRDPDFAMAEKSAMKRVSQGRSCCTA